MKPLIVLAAITAAVPPGQSGDPAVLVDQPVDYLTYFSSFVWEGAGVQSADDLILPPLHPVRIERVAFTMVVIWPDLPYLFSLEVYPTVPDDFWPWGWRPPDNESNFRRIGATEIIDHGEWQGGGWYDGDYALHEVEVIFEDLGFLLEPGLSLDDRWFFSPVGFTSDPNVTKSFLATAGHGNLIELNWSQGWFDVDPNTPWRPIRVANDMYPTDFAMRIEGEILPAIRLAELTDFEVLTGNHREGELEDLLVAEDSRIVIAPARGARMIHHIELIVRAETDESSPRLLNITIDSHQDTEGSTASVRLRNRLTGAFDTVGEYELGQQDAFEFIDGIDAAAYVGDDGEIELSILHSIRATSERPLRSHIDWVQIEVE